MRLRTLEMTLQKLEGYRTPQVALEQYMTPPPLAARLLFHAAVKGDIAGKQVCDLGCGPGILACGAALLGAARIVGVDLDTESLVIAHRNAANLGVVVEFLQHDVRNGVPDIGEFDTVVMNPPFGAQKKFADRPFIDAALALAPVVYGIFNEGSRAFIGSYIHETAEITESISCRIPVDRMFWFHRKDRIEICAEILRLERLSHG